MVVCDDMRFGVVARVPSLRPEMIQRCIDFGLLRQIGVQCDTLADAGLFSGKRAAKWTVAEPGIVEEVDVEVSGQGLCVDMPDARGPRSAVHEDQGW